MMASALQEAPARFSDSAGAPVSQLDQAVKMQEPVHKLSTSSRYAPLSTRQLHQPVNTSILGMSKFKTGIFSKPV